LRLPPLPEQHAIAHILGSLDDKIELNRRMNQTLEATARAIFKSWFVDFDPVRAKAEGRPTGLPDDIAALFPDSFEDSELEEIPKGWKSRSLYESAKYINGAAYRNFHFTDEEGALPVIKIAELKNGVSGQTKFTKTELDDKYRISDGEILLSWSGNPDTSIGTFVWRGGPAWLNQHIFRVLPHQEIEKHFVFYLLKYLRPVFAEIARDKQTTGLGHFTARDMKQLMVVHPPENILAAFNDSVGPMFDRWYGNLFESNTLASLRDTLLPKLISGEMRVPDAEKFVEETGV
jgi:type I restriction enzyme S subunit